MAGPGGNQPYTSFLESPKDRPSPEIVIGPGSGGVPPLSPSAYDDYGTQTVHPSEKPQGDGGPLEPSPFFSNVTPNPTRIVEACVATRREEERERLPTRTGGDDAYDRYHGRYDFSDKEDWQSKKVSPKLAISVERLVATLARIREKSQDWFTVEALEEPSEIYYNLVKNLIDFFLKHDDVNFNKQFRWILKTALLQQMAYVLVAGEVDGQINVESAGEGLGGEFGPGLSGFESLASLGGSPDESEGTPTLPGDGRWKPRIEVLNPDYVYKDATGRNRYIIWELRYSKGEAREEGEVRGWNMEALQRALANPVTTDDTTDTLAGFHEARDAAKQDKVPDYKAYSKVKITNFFGDLYDPNTGDKLLKNKYFIIANDKELVYGPVENPFWHNKSPVIDAPCIEVPFAAYGRSPVVWNINMFDLWIEYLNLVVDFMQSTLLGMKEVDISLLEGGEEEIRSGFFPGKVIPIDSSGMPNATAVKNVPFSDVPQGFWQHLQILQKELSDNVMLADSIGGQDRTRGRVTAMEFNRRATDAGAMIDYMFGTFEDNMLAPLIRHIFYVILQFMPQKQWADWVETHKNSIAPKDPAKKEIWEGLFEELKSWSPEKRWKKLAGFFKFNVRVFSALADRQMEIEKGTFMMQTVSQIPGAAQHIKWPKLLRNIVKAFGWDPEEIVSEEALPLPMGPEQPGEPPVGDTIPKGPSLGAPTNISTSPPSVPQSEGNPGTPSGTQTTGPDIGP